MMNVYFTVDTESSMAGAWDDRNERPLTSDRHIFCRIGEVDYGIGLITETLGRPGSGRLLRRTAGRPRQRRSRHPTGVTTTCCGTTRTSSCIFTRHTSSSPSSFEPVPTGRANPRQPAISSARSTKQPKRISSRVRSRFISSCPERSR